MTKISLFLFDLDGTLVDSRKDIAASVNYTMNTLGLPPLPDQVIYDFVGHGVTPLIQQSVDAAGGKSSFQEALKIFKAHYLEHLLDNTDVFEGVREVLEHFKKTPMVVITNKSQGFSEKILKNLKLDHYFKGVYGGDTSFPKKPDPAIVNHLLKQFGANPKETIIIGDSNVDIQTGKNSGILTCGALYGFRPREELQKSGCDWLIEKPKELLSIF